LDKIKGHKNIKKKVFGGILWVLITLIYIPLSLSYLSNQPLFQTFSARMTTMILTDMTGYNLSINAVNISITDGIEAGGLSIYDKHNNPMLVVEHLKAVPVWADWKILGVMLHEVKLDNMDFRLGKYHEQDTLNLMKFIHSFSSDTTKSTPSGSVFKLKIKKLIITDTHFELFNKSDTSGNGKAMDYSNMSYDNLNLDISHFKLYDDSLNFIINNLSAIEKSGIEIKRLSTKFILSSTTITGKEMIAELNHSFIDGDVSLNYKNWGSMSSFLDSVQLYGNFRKTSVDLSDIGYFADVMFPMKDVIKFSGLVTGTVDNLNCKNIDLFYGENTRFKGNIRVKDVTTFSKTRYTADIQKFSSSICDIQNFKLPDSSRIQTPENLECKEAFSISGKFDGNYYNFNTHLNIQSGQSRINAIASFIYKENDSISFNAMLNGELENAGYLLGTGEIIGQTGFYISATGKGKDFDDLAVETDLRLNQFKFLDYTYDSISFTGSYYKDSLQGKLTILDPNLALFSDIKLGFTGIPYYQGNFNIRKAHLKDLKLIDKDFSFASRVKLTITDHDLDKMNAHIKMDSTTLAFGKDHYDVKKITLDKLYSGKTSNIKFFSDFAEGHVFGNYKLTTLAGNVEKLLNNYFQINPELVKDSSVNENIIVAIKIKNDKLLSKQFLGGTHIAPQSTLNAHVDFKKDSLDLTFNSKMIKNSDIRFKNDLLTIKTKDNKMLINLKAEDLILKDSTESDPTKIDMENFNINSSINGNLVGFLINWDNLSDTTTRNSGKIQGYLFKQDDKKILSFDDVVVYTNDSLWSIDKNNKIIFDTSGIYFENFQINGGHSSLTLRGKFPEENKDSLSITFNKWNLSNLNPLLKNSGYSLAGFINGNIETSIVDTSFTVISDIKVNKFGFNKVYFGDLRIMNTWDNINQSIFIKSQIIKKGSAGVGQIFSLEGFYFPFRKNNSLNLKTKFNRMNIAFLNPILKDLFHKIKGKANGEFTINGSIDAPIILGKVKLNRTSMVINYLNTKYSFSNYLVFNHDKINFNNIVIFDTLGNSATIEGNITHKFFTEFYYDFHINTKKLLFVNTNRRLNDLYYGTAIASGDIHMWGGPNQLNLEIDTKTAQGTNLSIPLDQVYSTADNEYIHFIPPPVDSLALKKEETEKEFEKEMAPPEMKYDINIKANVTPEAKVNIYLPGDLGKIESQGHGILTLNTSSEGEFNMIGDYIVDRGNFNFNFKNLISKRFDIVPGGKITWTGDPTGAFVNIRGLYNLKVSLSSLGIVIDSTADYKNKQTVNCYIILKNKLLNPDIKFSIELPDADPDIRRMVFANLDTTNPAMVNEQMISLLVFGTFSFNNATNLSVAGQGYNILTNQLSSMLSKISNNVDIGMNYRPGDDISKQEFEVALSTQLFNDRLIIDGNVGMTYERGQKNASNIVGDVDVMYKLTRDGRWLLKAYNHSNANSWYYYNNYDKVSPYTQGVGIAYRKEFNNIAELLRGRKNKKKKIKKEKESQL
jgi:hypothetical protein